MENSNNSFRANASITIIEKLTRCHTLEMMACMVLDMHNKGIMSDKFMIEKTTEDYYSAVNDAVNAITTVLDIDEKQVIEMVKDPKGHFDLIYELNDQLFKPKEEAKEE